MKNFHHMKGRTFSSFLPPFLLIATFMLVLSGKVNAQAIHFCGELPANTATSTNPDSILFDRFGNSYDLIEFEENFDRGAYSEAGYFQLEYTLDITDDFMKVIQKVFLDLVEIIPQRMVTTSCDENILPKKVVILIEDLVDANPSVLASASALYGSDFQGALCNHVVPNHAQNRINGARKIKDIDGIMKIKVIPYEYLWNFDYNSPTTTGYVDLYSVVLHEALHILGFSSNFGLDAIPLYDQALASGNNIYSIWDDLMYVTPEYDENGMSSSVSKVLESTCSDHCRLLNSTVFPTGSAFNDAVEDNCSTSGGLDFMIGENGIAPIWGGGSGNDKSVVNSLSHLNTDCNGHGEDYIMQPSILPATDRRQITATELDILCELGYNVTGCNKCYLTSINTPTDLNYYGTPYFGSDEYNCCPRNYFVCVGEELIIPFEDLLCDKFSSGEMEIIDAYSTIPDPLNPEEFIRGNEAVISGETVIITPLSASDNGRFFLNYEVKTCDCVIERFVTLIRVGECLECTSTDICSNLVCTQGFEEMSDLDENNSLSYYEQIGGGYHIYEGNDFNGFGLCKDNTNTYAILLNKKTNNSLTKNGISFKLSHPIQPGCTATISFKSNSRSGNTAIEILGSEMPPCYFLDSKIKHGCQPTNCGEYIYNPICIENMNLSGSVPYATTSCSSTPNLTAITPITWVNEEDFPIHYIMFSANPLNNFDYPIYLDDFVVTNACPVDACFDFLVDCKTVNYESCYDEGFTHQWIFDDGNTSTEANPIHTYTTNGVYDVQHIITNICDSSTDTEIIEVVINCVECECDAIGSYNISAGAGELLSDLISASTVPATTINNKCISILGKLIVDVPYNIYSSEIKMQAGSEIEIIDGGRLFLLDVDEDGGIHGCDYMWKGISIQENGYLTMSNSIIQDAHHAVTLHDNSYHHITNTLFNKNYIGIFIPPDPLPNKMLNINQTFPMYGNIFDCEGENCILLPPYEDQPAMVLNKPYSGIIVNNAVYAIGSLQTGIVTHAPNNFYDVKNGIITSHSAIASYKSNFESPSGGSFNQFTAHNSIESNNSITVIERNKVKSRLAALHSRQDYGSRIINNEISRCWRGVNYLHSGLFVNDIISNNTMQVLTTGIYFNSHKSPIHISDNQLGKFNNLGSSKESIEILGQYVTSEIVNNRINLSYNKNGILLTTVTNALITQNEIRNTTITSTNDNPTGIKLADAENNIISKNEIYEVGIQAINSFGMQVNESKNNLICCNELDAGISIKFDGMCDDTELKNNELKGYHKVGLLCHESTSIGIQMNGGNTWANASVVPNGPIDAKHEEEDNQDFILQSQIEINDCPSIYCRLKYFLNKMNARQNLANGYI